MLEVMLFFRTTQKYLGPENLRKFFSLKSEIFKIIYVLYTCFIVPHNKSL